MFTIPYLCVPPSTFAAIIGGRFEICHYNNGQLKADFGSSVERLAIYCNCGVPGSDTKAEFDAIVADYVKWMEDQNARASESEIQDEAAQRPLFELFETDPD